MYKEFINIAQRFYEKIKNNQQLNEDIEYIKKNDTSEDVMLLKKHKDGEVPFKRTYLGYDEYLFEIKQDESVDLENNLSLKYKAEKRPLNPAKLQQFFNDFINVENFSKNGKIDILNKIFEDSKNIDKILEPLNKMNILYTIDITGGAARDFILNREKQIKDIDFMISIPKTPDLELKLHSEELLKNNMFDKKDLAIVNWIDNEDIDNRKTKLIKLCCNKQKLITKSFNINEEEKPKDNEVIIPDQYQTILRERIYGIIKLDETKFSDMKFNYPFDLLLSNMTKPTFLSHFDFDICKASFCIVNKAYKKEVPKEPLHLLSRFSAPTEFWADVANKRITLNTFAKNEKMLQDSVEKHLPKILKKYQGFCVGINEISDNSKQRFYIEKINSMIMNLVLQGSIKPKEIQHKKLKI